jgi:hypothetical protein
MIKHEGNSYNVYNEAGTKLLGKHPTKKKARAQLAAIEISKHAMAGKLAGKGS